MRARAVAAAWVGGAADEDEIVGLLAFGVHGGLARQPRRDLANVLRTNFDEPLRSPSG